MTQTMPVKCFKCESDVTPDGQGFQTVSAQAHVLTTCFDDQIATIVVCHACFATAVSGNERIQLEDAPEREATRRRICNIMQQLRELGSGKSE